MQYVLLIYQGSAWATIPDRSEAERRSIEAEYAALSAMPEIIPGPPLGLPDVATTVRVQDGTTLITDGPFVDAEGAVGGYLTLEADDLDGALEVASKIPAARLGGAIEVRPVEKYW
jgi:hypothetical protein